jgi:hypothetical protein
MKISIDIATGSSYIAIAEREGVRLTVQHSAGVASLVRCVFRQSSVHAPAHAPSVCSHIATEFRAAQGSSASTSQVPRPTKKFAQFHGISLHRVFSHAGLRQLVTFLSVREYLVASSRRSFRDVLGGRTRRHGKRQLPSATPRCSYSTSCSSTLR